jgi:hypothetical protein
MEIVTFPMVTRHSYGSVYFLPKEKSVNIDSMTYGELKQIAKLFSGTQAAPAQDTHPFVGKYVIARCYSAGVHAGFVKHVDDDQVILAESRRLWSWKAKDGVALSGVAQTGVQSGCKIDVVNPEIYLTGVCELIPCSAAAQESIHGFKK